MTDRQIKEAMKTIPHWSKYDSMTKEQQRIHNELSCREMINSIMIYGSINSPYNQKDDILHDYLQERCEHENSMFFVPRTRIIELVKEQQNDIRKAVVTPCVYTDSEGCTYNSCKWGDEE